MNLKLESVDAAYSIETDRLHITENYVPTGEPTAVMLITESDINWAKRKVTMSTGEFRRQKALWDIDGIAVRNGAGKVIGRGEVV